ncbi:hypothetical protein [Thermaurantiacus sp.]
MRRGFAGVAAGVAALLGCAPAAAQGVPEVIKGRVNELVAQCAGAGGTLGGMTGQGQFVIPRDFNGDGRTDFLVSEGNFPCTGRPQLFRPDGLARVQLFIADGTGGVALAFDDRLLAYRVLDGRPARLQIARRGPACGAARCGDELRWNAAAGRFDEHATDGRQVTARPAAGAVASAAASEAAPAAGATAAAAVPPMVAGAEARFKARCRRETLAQAGQQAANWVDGHCADMWGKAVAAQPLAGAVLVAHAAGAGPVDGLRRALPMVRWSPRAEQGELASGRLGNYGAGLGGAGGLADRLLLSWRATGAEIPVDLPTALEARGAALMLTSCQKTGVGEGERAWQVTMPGRAPFELFIAERTAPTGGALSYWVAEARLDGRPPRKGPTRCEAFW